MKFQISTGLLLAYLLLVVSTSLEASQEVDEYKLKAALVLNFARFASWPDDTFVDAKASLHLCVLGDETLHQTFEVLSKKKIAQHPVTVTVASPLKEVASCHVIFVTGLGREQLSRIYAAIADKPVLMIGEMPGFIDIGGMINLFNESGRLKFQVSIKNTQHAGIKLSSRLLKLAHSIEGSKTRP